LCIRAPYSRSCDIVILNDRRQRASGAARVDASRGSLWNRNGVAFEAAVTQVAQCFTDPFLCEARCACQQLPRKGRVLKRARVQTERL
jgi:hypothetical protein